MNCISMTEMDRRSLGQHGVILFFGVARSLSDQAN